MKQELFYKFTGTIDALNPANEGDFNEPLVRENLLSRGGRLKKIRGTQKANTTSLSSIVRWEARYYSIETGVNSPKTFFYTEDGNLYTLDNMSGTCVLIKSGLNKNASPKHVLIKTQNQTKMFLCDGNKLYKYDGNNSNVFEEVTTTFKPIDLEEHLNRLWAIDKTNVYCSKDLDFEVFDDATDSLDIIVGSGKGENLALIRLVDTLFIATTEGWFNIAGDTISAIAETFSVPFVSDKKAISGNSICKVEDAIVYLGDDFELWSFGGSRGSFKMLTYKLQLKRLLDEYKINDTPSCYFNNYYMMSFVEKGKTSQNLEVWWDAIEDKCEIIRGRNVSCYMKTDPTIELEYLQTGRSDIGAIMWTDREYDFDNTGIPIRLLTRNITPKSGFNVRFLVFYLEFEPTGNRNIFFRYLLDGRVSNTADADFLQNLQGEVINLGLIEIKNQNQTIDRIIPKINYSRGESIAFEIFDKTRTIDLRMIKLGFIYVPKEYKKGKKVGQ